jgi:hypothetical protein
MWDLNSILTREATLHKGYDVTNQQTSRKKKAAGTTITKYTKKFTRSTNRNSFPFYELRTTFERNEEA